MRLLLNESNMENGHRLNGVGKLKRDKNSYLLEVDEDDDPIVEHLRSYLIAALDGETVVQPYTVQQLFDFLQHTTLQIRWLSVHCLGFVLKLSETEKEALAKRYGLSRQHEELFELHFHTNWGIETRLKESDKDDEVDESQNAALPSNAVKNYTLESPNGESKKDVYMIVESKQRVVQDVHHSMLSKQWNPICLVGSTGVGKSTLIKLSAALFQRYKYPDIIFVQLSDQIDSRLLLGSYHSTDLPGQFVWKPGCLTKAVLHGHWVVLEDLDTAPPDVMTLLDSIVDSGSLSVPGYGEIKHFHQNFRLISTVRTFSGISLKKMDMKLGNRWRKIEIQDYSERELKLLLASLFPHLKNVAGKFASVFDVMQEANQRRGAKNRILSLRDFLKLCRRIPANLDLTKSASSVKVFQEALDLFVANFLDTAARKEVAEKLGAHFNILVATVEQFLTTYKPAINIDLNKRLLTAGRFTLPMYSTKIVPHHNANNSPPVYSLTKTACRFLEMVCGCVQQTEPVLLLGETGVGKTSSIQFLAQALQQKLNVINLNRQSDSADLLGGYKPVELKHIFTPLREEFETLFNMTFKRDTNLTFLNHIMTNFANKQWQVLLKLMIHVQKSAMSRRKKFVDRKELFERWADLGRRLSRIDSQIRLGSESPFAFSFIEGSLIEAVRKGEWILLDEINLATPEMLQCLAGVLEANGAINLWEKGDEAPVMKHKDFRLFAAMNPSTDVGKRDLPMGLRNRFTEFFVDELLDPDELQILVGDYLREMSLSVNQITNIVGFYLTVRKKAQTELTDGTGKRPHFSLRTLCRGLQIASKHLYGSISRSLYESFCISFLTQLDQESHAKVQALIAKHIFANQNSKSIVNQTLPQPLQGNYVFVEGFWIPKGDEKNLAAEKYILTTSVRRNLKDIARVVSAGKLPVLIQGETSVGKTSLIQYLAQITGNRCYRINNHQHTDLQEYLGSYQSDDTGRLVFVEGLLVRAMRRGEWIILDELNLAPSEVLEALNRLLDDNRQLFIAETGITVTAHPRFTLFATQNPPGLYGGRKLLSRAFRNRFVELHFDEIPSSELETILHLRCDIPPSYCKKIIATLKELQMRRKSSAALQGKHGFATLRDLFRWAERYRLSDVVTETFYDWDQHLADEGYLVLAGKVRQSSEAEVIIDVLKKHFKRTVNPENLFSLSENTSKATKPMLEKVLEFSCTDYSHVVWTFTMRRLAVLIGNAMKYNEPILLVGETGCGKTTMVQILSELFGRKLYSVNCHMNSEGSDFLGGLRPIRNRKEGDDRLFEWVNGPLVDAMISGGVFLADEISLADDSVLERINSVLEKERTLLVSEKGDEIPELIIANDNFVFVGTMNPGGDYGKKELSPALRNRLTEIWCPVYADDTEVEEIVEHNLSGMLKNKEIGHIMTTFCNWLKQQDLCRKVVISLRDFLAWTRFLNMKCESGDLSIPSGIIHGACLVFLDALGSGATSSESPAVWIALKKTAVEKLMELTGPLRGEQMISPDSCLMGTGEVINVIDNEEMLQIGEFQITKEKISARSTYIQFALDAPTTCRNGMRILRAMQLSKPILLEGSPGVGKTAIVTALAKSTNNAVVRINLSDQTDISDLFGADLPVEGETGGKFAWRDGPLLQALKNSSWILLDELNLASQSVLEGLNACLDHRGEIYVPELNRTFQVPAKTCRIFACQNPVRQGGARKGLPKSFLNRFTQVYVDSLELDDLRFIVRCLYPQIPTEYASLMTKFSEELQNQVCIQVKFGARGSPWDFNLRDTLRWCSLLVNTDERNADFMLHDMNDMSCAPPGVFVDHIYGLRMRSGEDRAKVLELFENIQCDQNAETESRLAVECGQSELMVLEDRIVCGNATLPRRNEVYDTVDYAWRKKLAPLSYQLSATEAIMKSLQMGWMPIIVGPASSGKSSLIKFLAQLCGKDLHCMCPSPEMDTMELLGSFEQADVYRRIDEVTRHLDQLMNSILRFLIVYHDLPNTMNYAKEMEREDFYEFAKAWNDFKNSKHLRPKDGLGEDEELARIHERTEILGTSYSKCKSLLERLNFIYTSPSPSSGSLPPPSAATERLFQSGEEVERELEEIYRHLKAGIQTGSFHWIHSLLIKAMIKGDWLLIDGANRCSSAVLDRLNSLVEPQGSLFLTERGAIDGEIIEIRPHPEFRLILAMNPAYGEISRAMRNRGVEIYLPGAEEDKELMKRTEDGFMDANKSLIRKSKLVLSPENFLNSKSYRVWKSFHVFDKLREEVLKNFGGSAVGVEFGEKILLLTAFWRSMPQDVGELTALLSTRLPELKALASKMGTVKVLKKDKQFEPGFVGRYKNAPVLPVQVITEVLTAFHRSLSLHQHILKEEKLNLEAGSVAFMARNIADQRGVVPKELEDSLVLFKSYWKARTNLEDILQIIMSYKCWEISPGKGTVMLISTRHEPNPEDAMELEDSEESSTEGISLEHVAGIWLQGIKSFMGLRRLVDVGEKKVKGEEENNEMLFGRMRILLESIKSGVVPWLKMICADDSEYGPLNKELRSVLKSICYEKGRNAECIQIEKLLRETCFPVDSLQIDRQRENALLGFMKTVFNIWSFRSVIPQDNWPAALKDAHPLYRYIAEGCGAVLRGEEMEKGTQEALDTFVRTYRVETIEESDTDSSFERKYALVQKSLNGLQEYLRLIDADSQVSSVLTNPFLSSMRSGAHTSRLNVMQDYLEWEERRRFCNAFTDLPSGLVQADCLLPYFVARIFFGGAPDNTVSDYWLPSLKGSGQYKETFSKLTKMMSHRIFQTQPPNQGHLVDSLRSSFRRDLTRVVDLMNDPQDYGIMDQTHTKLIRIQIQLEYLDLVTMEQLGEFMVQSAMILMEFLAHLPPVDPAVESKILGQFCEEDIRFFTSWTSVQSQYEEAVIGQAAKKELEHPYRTLCTEFVRSSKDALVQHNRAVADRPRIPQYRNILKDVTSFLGSLASKEKLGDLVEDIKLFGVAETVFQDNVGAGKTKEKLEQLCSVCDHWIAGHMNFVDKLSKNFMYWDVVAPIIYVSTWASTGLSILKHIMVTKYQAPKSDVADSLRSLVTFPMNMKGTTSFDVISDVISLPTHQKNRLYLSSLLNSLNVIAKKRTLSHESMENLHAISKAVSKSWYAQKEKTQQMEAEKDALYIFKGKERLLEASQEQLDAEAMKEAFPNFRREFQDLIPAQTLGDTQHLADNSDPDEMNGELEAEVKQLLPEDINLFIKVQFRLMDCVRDYYFEPANKVDIATVDTVTPFMQRFIVGCRGYNEFSSYFNQLEDQNFSVGAYIASSQCSFYPDKPFAQIHKSASLDDSCIYDIYHDSNPGEVKMLISILQSLRKRIQDLLEEWPDFPSLMRVISIIDRIESFKLEDPIIKFLTGVELLVETGQEWEDNAHKGVSIASHLLELFQVIIKWRKMELSCWKNLLDLTQRREEEKAYEWWFHISNMAVEFIEQKYSNEEAVSKASTLLLALHQFMETSNLGQYEVRINILTKVYCYILAMEKYKVFANPVPPALYSAFWNTIKYYQEFLSAAKSKLNNLKQPVEKKLKDFVKICRWNDMNLSALKDSISNSQKMLMRSMKDVKQILAFPARSVMICDEQLPPKLKAIIIEDTQLKWYTHDPESGLLPNPLATVKDVFGENDQIRALSENLKVQKLSTKIRAIQETCVEKSSSHFRKYHTTVSELSEGIATTLSEMQVFETTEKGDVRKKLLHHVHSRRRLAVADIFKDLANIGLSFRKGLIRLQSKETYVSTYLYDFLTQPHDLSITWDKLKKTEQDEVRKKTDTLVSQSWVSLESYFQKCLIRMISAMSAFESPNKQLTLAIIERCRGFAAELIYQLILEKKLVAQFSTFVWMLRSAIQRGDENDSSIKSWEKVEAFREHLAGLSLEFEQWKIVLQSSDAPLELHQKVTTMLTLTSNLLTKTLSWEETNVTNGSLKSIGPVIAEFLLEHGIESLDKNASVVHKKICESMQTSLSSLMLLLPPILEEEEQTSNESSEPDVTPDSVASLVARIMLAMQRLSGHYSLETDLDKPFNISAEISYLDLSNLIEELKKVLSDSVGRRKLPELKPLLNQYIDVSQFYLTELVHVHRSHCQLFVNMSSLFMSIGQKGFNLPPDYEEEAMKEGSELDAKGGLGLGEGETTSDAKDVSDRIESEDQLEETLKPGESTEQADKDVEEDDAGIDMTEDFGGKLQDQKKSGEDKEGSDDENEKEEEENQELDKEMGDIDDPGAEKLDEQLWGGSSDEEEDLNDDEDNAGGQKLQGDEPELRSKDLQTEKPGDEQQEEENGPPEKQKESKEMDSDGEQNDDQIDPFHGQDVPEIEPEAFDLPDDLNLDDDAEMKDNEEEDENPFDLDSKKDNPEIEGDEKEDEDAKEEEMKEVENEIRENPKDDEEGQEDEPIQSEAQQMDKPIRDEFENQAEEPMEVEEEPEKPQNTVPENGEVEKDEERQVEADPENQAQADSNAENKASKDEETDNQTTVEEHEPNQQDDSGKGQAETSSGAGHDGRTATKNQQESKNEEKQDQQSSNNPAENERKRTLATQQEEPSSKRLRALESLETGEDDATPENDEEGEKSGKEFDLYQHVTRADKFDDITMDNASKEDAEQQQAGKDQQDKQISSDKESEAGDSDIELIEEDTTETENTKRPSEKQPKKNRKTDDRATETEENNEAMVEGDAVSTFTVSRPDQSAFFTQNELIYNPQADAPMEPDVDEEERGDQVVPRVPDGPLGENLARWHELESETLPLAQDLCEQLRLILEPTLAARLKGDYKTGKRLNMRKVIPYVASGFRKDKIWLRRTQPSKREYQILLALDDSASMSDNQSKQMAFSAVAVVAKALGLLEAGELGVVSFGEDVQLMHPFEEPFTDSSGAQLLQKFTFCQRQTRIGQLMNYVTQTFKDLKNRSHTSSTMNPELAQLVLIISDGRNVASEGKDCVARAIRRARDENIFIVFIIVDNPKNKDSILDIRYAEFDDKNNLKQFNYYMDHFPFPFYLILRDLSNLPSVLTDALRQWFELVTSNDR